MAINYGANYIGVDRDRYDAGNKFYSQDRFLQGVGLDKPAITFNSSPDNSGIMGMYPRYPIIPQYGGDGDGGGPFGGIDKGEITSDVGFGNLNDQTGMGYTLTEEDKEAIASQRNKDRLAMAGKLGLFALNPMGYLMGKVARKGVGMVKDRFFSGDDSGGDGPDINPGTFTKESIDQSFAGEEGPTGGGESTSSDQGETSSDSGFSDDQGEVTAAEGGRIGYRDGGLSKYEIFKLGELGYNTKGGTVTAPFGGVKVLRDILRVNQYAGGGIVGLYR